MFNRLLPILRGCQQSCASVTTPASAICLFPRIITGRATFCYSPTLFKKQKIIRNEVDLDEDLDDEDIEIDDGLPKDYKEMTLSLTNIRLDGMLKRASNLKAEDVEKK